MQNEQNCQKIRREYSERLLVPFSRGIVAMTVKGKSFGARLREPPYWHFSCNVTAFPSTTGIVSHWMISH